MLDNGNAVSFCSALETNPHATICGHHMDDTQDVLAAYLHQSDPLGGLVSTITSEDLISGVNPVCKCPSNRCVRTKSFHS